MRGPSVGWQEAKQIVGIWEGEFSKQGPMIRKLALLYVANDILQNSRKKGVEFVAPFYHPILRALRHIMKHGDDKVHIPNIHMLLRDSREWPSR